MGEEALRPAVASDGNTVTGLEDPLDNGRGEAVKGDLLSADCGNVSGC